MQLGFDLVYTDPNTQEVVPWAMPLAPLLADIQAAPWKVVDVETTGLNPASKEQNFSAKDVRRGIDPRLRMRIVSALYINTRGLQVVSFDLDQATKKEAQAVCDAVMSGVAIAHNAGFDAYWTRLLSKVRPRLLLDSMLMARVLRPDHPVNMAKLCGNDEVLPELRQEAEAMFMQGRSGWSLADLAVGLLGRVLPKDMQGPKNWCEPFLSQRAYDYATDDVRVTFDVVLNLFGLSRDDVIANPQLLLERYEELKVNNRPLRIVEPQVQDVIEMRLNGMPWVKADADEYVAQQWKKVHEAALKMVELEPTLAPHLAAMSNAEKGVTADLKVAIGQAFANRGIELETTEKSGAFKIGEKDLRRVKAAVNSDASDLFNTWVGLNRAKKAGGMAREFTAYAVRSGDDRLHPNTGHGPVTGRLSSSEPNCQQMPRDQGFRNCVRARPGYKIVASDYSALDMRVGAALAIRAQRQILEAYMGDRKTAPDALDVIERVLENRVTLEAAQLQEVQAQKAFDTWKARVEEVTDDPQARKRYWEVYRKRARAVLLSGFQRCLKEVRMRAEAENTPEWGSLRDAFSIKGMDIHTWTALGMIGKDPKALFAGLSGDAVAAELKKWKKELGDKRQTGKVGNLSLLYAMKTLGLMDAAAKNYNIHWTFEEADKVRNDWLAAYVEIDLWHKWTELNPTDSVYVPDPERGNRFVRKSVFASYTLGDRLIYAFGLNAALSYEDQSTGADILGLVMQTLRSKYPEVFATVINQVHDELVFEVPDDHVDEYTTIIDQVMTDCAEHFLMPYGVRGECSPAIGQVWLKD